MNVNYLPLHFKGALTYVKVFDAFPKKGKGFFLMSGFKTNISSSLGQVNPNSAAAGNRTLRLA